MTLLQSVTPDRDRFTSGHPFDVPAVAKLERLVFDRPVTFFAGENGTGKSTLLEAIAVASGCPLAGGIADAYLSGPKKGPGLAPALTIGWRDPKPIGGAFFLRAETFYGVAAAARNPSGYAAAQLLAAFEDHDPLELSHGESFLQLFAGRFAAQSVFFLDEPEAPLSFRGCLSLMLTMHDLVRAGSQFIVATHSPVLMAFPDAAIVQFDGDGTRPVAYDESDVYLATRDFLAEPQRFLRHLFDDG